MNKLNLFARFYHGQQGNIELGTLIESKQIAKQIDDVFTKMIFSKVFSEV